MFQPVIPASGLVGWNFLQATYDRQLQSFSDSAQVKADKEYMLSKLSTSMTKEAFLDDRRLLRITMTAYDLGGEEWKRGFIDKVLTEGSDPESSFLTRLNNPQYTRFAEMFQIAGDRIILNEEDRAKLGAQFEQASFKLAVGEVNNDMRLALNYQSEVNELVREGSTDKSNIYRLLGSVPVRSVLESALGLPTDIRKLPIEQQADIVQGRLSSQLGVNSVLDLRSPDVIDKAIQRFHAIQGLTQGPSASTPGSVALTLLSGIGTNASANLFQILYS